MALDSSIEIGIAIPQVFAEGPVDMGLVRDFVVRADDLGFHSLWAQEQIVGDVAILEPVSLLCYVAGVTSRARLGTAVVIATQRNPVLLAKSFSTLDQMSEGRLIAGVALGGRPANYAMLGGPSAHRVTHFLEFLKVIRGLWESDTASIEGRFWHLDGVAMEPKPAQTPRPPIWLGGRHPAALRRAARLADGWMGAGSTASKSFMDHVAILRAELERLGRDPATFAISKRVYVAVDDDEARAEHRLRDWFGRRYGSADLANRVAVWGSIESCTDRLAEIAGAGAEMLMLNPVFDHMEHLSTFAGQFAANLASA